MPEARKRPAASTQRKKAPASAKSREPALASAKPKKRSASVIGSEGILIHTDEGYFYLSEQEYKAHKLPRLGTGMAKVLTERGCIVANIPDDVGRISGAYCILLSIVNLKKTAG